MPHSEFLSWSDLDREKALAYALDDMATCKSCGTKAEDFDPQQGGHRFAYVAEVTRCVGCELIEMEQENVAEDNRKGIRIGLTANPDLERRRG
jgi:hypothetical protein